MKTMVRLFNKIVRSDYFWLIVILLFAFLVRLYKISNPVADWHSWRQADTASVSKSFLEKGIKIIYPSYQDISSIQTGIFNPEGFRMVEVPFFNLLHVIFYKIFPFFSFDANGRLVSIVCSLISIILVFLIGKRFLGKLGSLLSAFFFAFLPYNIYFSRVILPEPMAVTFALASIVFFIKFIDQEKTFYLYLSGIVMAISVLIKPFSIFYMVPILYLAISKYGIVNLIKNSKLLIRFLVFVNLSILPFLLWRIWINQYPEGIPFFDWAFNGDKIRFRPAFWRWIFTERLAKLILGIWGLPIFMVGVFWSKVKHYFIHFFLLGIFLYVSVVATANVRHDYYQIFAVPAISLALASGVLGILNIKGINRLLSYGGLGFSIGMMFFIGIYQVKEYYKINHPEIIIAGQAVQRLTSKESLIIAPYNGDTAFLYQTGRWGWPVIDDDISNLIKRGADYYISVTPNDKDTQNLVTKYETVDRTDQYVLINLHNPIKK